MVLCVKVNIKNAELVKKYVIAYDQLERDYYYDKDENFVYFPIKEKFEIPSVDLLFEERDLQKKEENLSWREAAKKILSPEECALGRFSYDSVGSIAIIEVVDELLEREKELAVLLLETDKHITTVLKKAGGHEGEFRVQKMTYLAGENTRETIVNENGCRFKVHVEQVYFSVRLSTERKRIAGLISPEEQILCMFSGAGPYPIVFSKNTSAKDIIGIEVNPVAHQYAQDNLLLNKIKNVIFYHGDVKKLVPVLLEERKKYGLRLFDRITMPLPHTGEEFLPTALKAIAPSGTIHYYTFIDKADVEKEQERIRVLVDACKKSCWSIIHTICGQHSPKKFRVCFDIVVE